MYFRPFSGREDAQLLIYRADAASHRPSPVGEGGPRSGSEEVFPSRRYSRLCPNPPYSYFRYSIIREQGADGTWHNKMSGFDGSYFIIRVDVSDLIKDAPAGSYLHVKQEGNKALMVSLLYEKSILQDEIQTPANRISN